MVYYIPAKINRKFSENTKDFENMSKSVFQDFELKPFFHYSLTVFHLSEKQFRKLSEHC